MEPHNSENIYETERMVFFRVKYLTQEHLAFIRGNIQEWNPNLSYDRNRVIYNKQLNQFYDLEINDKIACIYTYDPEVIITEEYIYDVLDFLTISIKKICTTPIEANCYGFTLRVYKKNDKGYHKRSILGKQFPCQMEEIIYPFQFDDDFSRLKLRNVSDSNNITDVRFGTSDSNKSFGGNNNSGLFGTSDSNKSFGGNNNSGLFGTSYPNTTFGVNDSNGNGVRFGTSDSNKSFGVNNNSGLF